MTLRRNPNCLINGIEGTRIVAILPVGAAPDSGDKIDRLPAAGSVSTGSIATEPPHQPATILCIDDEASGLLARRLLLESAGYRVIEAHSGPEGIRLFQSENVSVVILDYWMSGMKGTVVAAELKRRRVAWKPRRPYATHGVLGKYARVVSSASMGAVTDLVDAK
jgi:CheY-like chemotaxis protein